jgi:hypothetical protein
MNPVALGRWGQFHSADCRFQAGLGTTDRARPKCGAAEQLSISSAGAHMFIGVTILL